MPILMSKAELERIKRWTDSDREDPEVVRRRTMVKWMDATSKEMTKNWPNSVENVNKRNEELRRTRIEAAEQANATFYKKYVKRQQEQQQRLMHSARDIIFKNKDAPKLMLSAVIETCVQKEREEQIKFLNELRRMDAEQKKKDDDEVHRKAREWHDLMKLKAKRRFDANKEHQREILEQAHERAEKNRMEYETELKMQQIDNKNAQEEIAALKDFEEKFNAAEKARIWSDMNQARQEEEQRRSEQRARDDMDERLLQVLLNSRSRVERRRVQTEKDVKNEKLRILEKISAKLESGDAARNAKEQEMLNKALKEKEAIDAQRRAAQAERLEKFRQERILQRQQFLRDEEQRVHDFNTKRQFEIMNRFKNAELYEDHQENLRQEKARKIKEFREDTLRLWKEREDREARERAETRYFYGELALKKIRDADNKLFYHAAALIDEAKQNDRPDYPIRKALDRYCKIYRLYPMPDLPKSMKEHFQSYEPQDCSNIDPEYMPPPPPPPDLGPDLDPDDAPKPGCNGLDDARASTSKPAPAKEEHVDDYKRSAKANGLQRRRNALVAETTLPPISVIPCELTVCTCGTKK